MPGVRYNFRVYGSLANEDFFLGKKVGYTKELGKLKIFYMCTYLLNGAHENRVEFCSCTVFSLPPCTNYKQCLTYHSHCIYLIKHYKMASGDCYEAVWLVQMSGKQESTPVRKTEL